MYPLLPSGLAIGQQESGQKIAALNSRPSTAPWPTAPHGLLCIGL